MQLQSDNTAPVFRFKYLPKPDLPGGTLKIREGDPIELPQQEWEVCHEPLEGPDSFYDSQIAPHIINRGLPALITGAAGTGKSFILQRLETDLKALGHEVRKVTLTHVACRRLGDASTCCSFVHRKYCTVDTLAGS